MYSHIHQSIFLWYQKNGRHDLPWRQTKDPYKIWLSEIMLQQTQVKTVLERFYFPFLKRFPTLLDLAQADEDAVMKRWEGLGYYTRARNLHKSAILCKTSLPSSAQELEKLSGVGPSTAHAIACFAYGDAKPILDANVKRILCRFFALKEKKDKELWQKAWELLDEKNPYEYNQALMDIGSNVCTQKDPKCYECPLETLCQGKTQPSLYPTKKAKKNKPKKERFIVVYECQKSYSLSKNTNKLLGGLWGFVQNTDKPKHTYKDLGRVKQSYSHFDLVANVLLVNEPKKTQELYFTFEQMEEIAMSGVDRKVHALLKSCKI